MHEGREYDALRNDFEYKKTTCTSHYRTNHTNGVTHSIGNLHQSTTALLYYKHTESEMESNSASSKCVLYTSQIPAHASTGAVVE